MATSCSAQKVVKTLVLVNRLVAYYSIPLVEKPTNLPVLICMERLQRLRSQKCANSDFRHHSLWQTEYGFNIYVFHVLIHELHFHGSQTFPWTHELRFMHGSHKFSWTYLSSQTFSWTCLLHGCVYHEVFINYILCL